MAVYIEQTVKVFSRYHKYTLGTDMRNLSREIVQHVIPANSKQEKADDLTMLRDTLERLKISVRVGKELKAFKNFSTFTRLMEEVISISRQCEDWLKSMRGIR